MNNIRKLGLAVAVASVAGMTACGGSSSSGTGATPPDSVQTGVFVDSPVGNIGYRTPTYSGVTSAAGEYQYTPGENVVFFIGDLEFPPVPAAGIVTPLDIAGTTDTSNQIVLNIARLLQTLDTDGDPSNGISISEAAKNNATQVDFDVPEADFENSAAVTTLIQNGGQNTAVAALVSAEQAKSHLENTLEAKEVSFTNETSITGGWLLDTGPDQIIFLAFDARSQTYVQVEEKGLFDEEQEGLEFGHFNLDADTNILTSTGNFYDEHDNLGLYPGSDEEVNEFVVNGDAQLVIRLIADEPDEETLAVHRVTANGLQGTWVYEDTVMADGEVLLLAFLDNGTYVHAEVFADAGEEDTGAETGTYEYDSTTGVISITSIRMDTNGEAGLSAFVGTADLLGSVTGNQLTLTVTENGQTEHLTFNRL